MSTANAHAASVSGSPRPGGETVALPGGVSPEEFKLAFRNHPAGVAVITADAGQGPAGLTATSVFSISAEPPLLIFSLSTLSSSTPTIVAADTVVVHLLGARQHMAAKRFATSGIDRFADVSTWGRLPGGEPYLLDAAVLLRGRIIDRLDAGSSTVVVVHVLDTHVGQAADEPPLVYHNRTWHQLDGSSALTV
ncbi:MULTISPECIES: flavin reductase family protein [unclassified Microbacterium]|uniref:flavin reductase family protein n=1 Tax=unclassified Microbacterium TaxID=2609290 RepID=UPI00214CA49A|nr:MULTISPECIES: flavin reductase family protein [unclassified Microbacterium]MCR2783275.1 flavin reductase family protein [Microbacterium sp. zg.B96]MDL5351941.1 flavin reductase family protein [Microbacterium sp. zg-YB36]WIM15850.1 flavin reductase family protein [Microbacterium sp. zg-B96]